MERISWPPVGLGPCFGIRWYVQLSSIPSPYRGWPTQPCSLTRGSRNTQGYCVHVLCKREPLMGVRARPFQSTGKAVLPGCDPTTHCGRGCQHLKVSQPRLCTLCMLPSHLILTITQRDGDSLLSLFYKIIILILYIWGNWGVKCLAQGHRANK